MDTNTSTEPPNTTVEPTTPETTTRKLSPDRDSATSPPRESVCALRAYDTFLTCTGLKDDELSQAAYQVHEDLRVIRKWTQLEVTKREDEKPIISGIAPSTTDAVYNGLRRRYVVPVLADSHLTAPQLYNLGITNERCVTIAIVDDDSTTAYYRLFNNWDEIVHPAWKAKSKDNDNDTDDDSV